MSGRLQAVREAVPERLVRWSGSSLVLGTAIALLTWPREVLAHVGTGGDESAYIGLHMGTWLGLDYGPDLIYTYGPLSFLTLPRLSYPLLAVLALFYVIVVQVALAASTLWAMRRAVGSRAVGLPLAVLAAGLVASVIPLPGNADRWSAAVITIILIWSVAALHPDAQAPGLLRAYPWAAGALTALEGLIKHNSGLTVTLICLVTVAASSTNRRRALTVFGGALLVTGTALWALAGQSFTALPTYLSRSNDILSGFSSAMQDNNGATLWQYNLVPPAVLLAGAMAVWGTARWPWARRCAAWAIGAIVLFAGFKQGFVRQGPSHTPFFFASALGIGVAFSWTHLGATGTRAPQTATIATRSPPRAVAALAAAGVALLLAGCLDIERPIKGRFPTPLDSLAEARAQLRLVRHLNAWIANDRQAVRDSEQIAPALVERLRGHGVHVWPEEAVVVWAYPELRWDPLPVFQDNLAFRPRLDHANASRLADSRGPDRVLRATQPAEPDYAPAARLALFCRYRQIAAEGRWQVLARAADRCGREVPAGSVRLGAHESSLAPRPRPREAIVARIDGLGPSLGERALTFVFKGPTWQLNEGDREGRLQPELGDVPLLVAAGREADYPGAYAFVAPRAALKVRKTSALREIAGGRADRGRLTIRYYRIALSAPATAPG